MEQRIAMFMLKTSKFEFYLLNKDVTLARTRLDNGLDKIVGINWLKFADYVERRLPFSEFDFQASGFDVFRKTAPQYLVKRDGGGLKWDSDDVEIRSWACLLGRSFAQFRNNIAHGNKAMLLAPFTHDRTERFLEAGERLIEFLARELFDEPDWELPIEFR